MILLSFLSSLLTVVSTYFSVRHLKSVALPSTYLRRTFGEATSEGGAAGGDDGMDDAGNGADGADWFDAVK